MIFNLFQRVVVKVGEDEKHIFDRKRLMYTEVVELEKVTGLSYLEWEQQLGRYSITAVAAVLHVLRKRDGLARRVAAAEAESGDGAGSGATAGGDAATSPDGPGDDLPDMTSTSLSS